MPGSQTTSEITQPPSISQSLPLFQPEQSHGDEDTWIIGGVNNPIDLESQDFTAPELFSAGEDWTSNVLEPLCTCYQETTRYLSALRAWILVREPSANPRITATINCAKVEDFLPLFEESFAQLQRVEKCSRGCILSQDLAVPLLLVTEQLAKILQDLAEDFRLALSLSLDCMQESQTVSYNGPQQEHTVPPVKIGSFEIKDTIALLMITKTLLQIRTNALDMYICRWGEKAKQYGLGSIEIGIHIVREGLSKIMGT
ncbi:hypothetical protein F4803DRAFT_569394 [Xylaria telfairii]|nr:hypothetical protein F4803DRAFT_569394 [Xylaria telfairii]